MSALSRAGEAVRRLPDPTARHRGPVPVDHRRDRSRKTPRLLPLRDRRRAGQPVKAPEEQRRKQSLWRLRCAKSLLSQAAQLTDDMQAWNYVHAAFNPASVAVDRIA